MGLREQSSVGCFPEFVFQFFRGAGACGVPKDLQTNLFFPLGPLLLVLIIIIIITALVICLLLSNQINLCKSRFDLWSVFPTMESIVRHI